MLFYVSMVYMLNQLKLFMFIDTLGVGTVLYLGRVVGSIVSTQVKFR